MTPQRDFVTQDRNLVGSATGQQYLVCLDAETFLIQTGRSVPPLVVFGITDSEGDQWVIKWNGDALFRNGLYAEWEPRQVDPVEIIRHYLRKVKLLNGRWLNQNLAFDSSVLANAFPELIPDLFEIYDLHLCECTIVRERLIDIAKGSLSLDKEKRSLKTGKPTKKFYSLKDLIWRYFKVDLDKESWRKGYGELYNLPLAYWEKGAIDYVVSDTVWTLALYKGQEEKVDGEIPNSVEQAKYDWALHLIAAWGMITDGDRVTRYRTKLHAEMAIVEEKLKKLKLLRPTGSKDMKAIRGLLKEMYEALKVEPMLTESGDKAVEAGEPVLWEKHLATSGEAIEDLALAHESWKADGNYSAESWGTIQVLNEHSGIQKIISGFIPVVEKGSRYPINPRYQVLVETGRASCSQPNIMQMPKAPGIRECFIPRDGYVFCSVDYEALELHTLAQVLLVLVGHSALADALNSGVDPHSLFAANYLLKGMSYEDVRHIYKNGQHPQHEAVKLARNTAKSCNFGLGGALGATALRRYLKNSGIFVTEERAKFLKEAFLLQWPEMRDYFRFIKSLMEEDENGDKKAGLVQLFSNRVRGNVTYSACCNSWFQGLGADAAKEGTWLIQKACYVPGGALYGSRTVVFMHDETIMEHPIADARARGYEQARLMRASSEKFCPDVPLKALPCLMTFWSKSAVETYVDENGSFTHDAKTGIMVPWDGNFSEIVGC